MKLSLLDKWVSKLNDLRDLQRVAPENSQYRHKIDGQIDALEHCLIDLQTLDYGADVLGHKNPSSDPV